MQKDVADSSADKQHAYHLQNMRLRHSDTNTLTALVNEEGTQKSISSLSKRWRWFLLTALWSQVLILPAMLSVTPTAWQWLAAQTRQQLRISIEAYQATDAETVTKWFEGQQFTFPTSAWLQMLNALEVYAAEALNVTEAHKAAVMAMDSVEDIENYDITSGYPEKLNLTTEWLRSQS